MSVQTIVSSLFISVGAAIMLISIMRSRELAKAMIFVAERQRIYLTRGLMLHRGLMIFFFFGYLAVLTAVTRHYSLVAEIVLSIIFLFGAIFVFTGIIVQSRLLSEVQKTLQGILPICGRCKKIRIENGTPKDPQAWKTIESYISEKTDVGFSHGLCPTCFEKELKEIIKTSQPGACDGHHSKGRDAAMKMFFAISVLPSLFGVTTPVYADTCVSASCHQAIVEAKRLHQPVKDGECLSCHRRKVKEHPLKGGKSFEPAATGTELCGQCHDAVGKKKVVHAPVKAGECLACHKVHGANGRFLIDDNERQTELCLGCHDGAPFNQKVMHGPVASGSCTTCHDPHEATLKGLLKQDIQTLCLGCHTDFAQSMKEAKIVHAPVKNDRCTSCHNPHGSAYRSFLQVNMPNLCYGCHAAVEKVTKNLKVPHKPLQQANSCGTCHSTHFSNSRGLLSGDQKSLCLGCHGTDKLKSGATFRNLSGTALKNMRTVLGGKKNLHGPLAKGECSGCHSPHGSNYLRILKASYPPTFYARTEEGSYDLCFSCHEKGMLKYADTALYTKFRNGKKNLHYLHVSDGRKGRSCRACHASHASDGQKLINSDGELFGDWRVKTRFTQTATGGSCSPGCHRTFRYDRDIPVDYTQSK